MLLIDTLKLYDHTKKIDLSTPKSVVVIKDQNDSLYGMVVDEIIKIDDVEVAPLSLGLSNEEIIINHYKEQDKLINEIVPLELLHAKNIPSFFVTKEEEKAEDKKITHEFLLFKIDEKLFAIESIYVKEVLTKENDLFDLDRKTMRYSGAISIRDEVVKVANIEHEMAPSEIIVVEKDYEEFCILSNEVLEIEEFEIAKIEPLSHATNFIKAFYNLDAEVVAIVNVDYFLSRRDVVIKDDPEEINAASISREAYLVFDFGEKEFSISMQNVRQVFQTEDIAQNKSSIVAQNSNVVFITTWNNHAIEVIKLDTLLNVETKMEDSQTIIVEYNGNLKGFIVNNLDDILYVEQSKVAISQTKSIIDGAIVKDKRIIPKLSSEKILEVH